MKKSITIEIDTERLETFNDSYLARLWHVAQTNPAPIEDRVAGEIAESIGREIIRRWLKSTPPELYNHQGTHHFWTILQKHGEWSPINGDSDQREWKPMPSATQK